MKTGFKCLILFLGCLFVFPLTIKAECSYEREAELSRIASNVQFSYSYETNPEGAPSFKVHISNVSSDIYVEDDLYETIVTDPEAELTYNFTGDTIKYNIYSRDSECYGERILASYIDLPKFNIFSRLEICNKYPDFKYCQMWANTSSLTQEQFDDELERYTKSISDDKAKVQTENVVVNFVSHNILLIAIATVVLVILLLAIRFKRRM